MLCESVHPHHIRAMTSETEFPDNEIEPVGFDLADGAKVSVALGYFWSKVTESGQSVGQKPVRYLARRVYTDEGTRPKRVAMIHEFFHGINFERRFCPKIWQWLIAHSVSQERLDHESADDFLTAFEEAIDQIHSADEDMIEHLESLPSLILPSAFDPIDDSIFTDQSDPEIR